MAIGICDWGIGGIGLYKLIRERSNVDVIYFSDAGFTPYGKVPTEELRERLQVVFEFFRNRGVTQIAVACNAASTVIPQDKNTTGIIEHAIEMVSKLNPETIAVVGGKRTIESDLYKNALEKKGIKTTQRIAQVLSARIEAGDIASKELDNDIQEIFEPIKNSDYVLLACTHYPVIAERINTFTPASQLLDPSTEMAEWIFSNWKNLSGQSNVTWTTTGDVVQMKSAASKSFGIDINEIENIQL